MTSFFFLINYLSSKRLFKNNKQKKFHQNIAKTTRG